MSELPFVIPKGQEVPTAPAIIIPDVVRSASQLARAFALENVQITQSPKENYKIPQPNYTQDAAVSISATLGTIVLSDLTFHSQTYQDDLGNSFTFPDIVLQTVLLSVNQSKNIVKTQIQGRNGSIKEYISLGDYMVTINAIICGPNGVYPKSDMKDLITMLNCNQAISVTSWYLMQFGIFSIVIETYDINQDEGQYSRQTVSISASSDREVSFTFQA
jgi:hypothetical protein